MNELSKEQETELVESAKQSQDGFARLYDMYFDVMFHYILKRTGDLELTKDLTSETFMKVLNFLPRYKVTEVPFACWLYRIATNEINQHFRKKRLLFFDFLEPHEEPTTFETPEDEVKQWEQEKANKMEFTLMLEYIKKLAPLDQSIITLRYFEDRKFSEIGDILNVREGTVKVRMNRALNKLRRWMKGSI